MIALILALGAGSLVAGSSAASLPAPRAAHETTAAQDQRATEWPKAADEAAVKRSVAKLRKAANDEMEAAGRAEIEAAGAASAPFLLRTLSKERSEPARERLTGALDAVTAADHTGLLAEHFADKSEAVRRYAVRRVAALGDSGLRETAEALLADLEARAEDKKSRKKVDALDLDLAAILCISTGSPDGLTRALKLADPDRWIEWRATLRPAAASARAAGEDVGKAVAQCLGKAETSRERVAALNLLAYAGTKDLARYVRPSLESEENQVKVAAINALRMMVDGDPPLDKLSTFDAIERANRWKGRI